MAIEFSVDHDHTYASEIGFEQLIGWITFSVGTAPGDFRYRDPSAGLAQSIKLPPRRGWLAADGHLYRDQTLAQPCRLVANDPLFNLRHVTYRVDFALTTLAGDPVPVPPTYFPAPSSDTLLQLTKVMTDPYQPVMEVRAKVYTEDILDAGEFGTDLLFTGTTEDFWELAGTVPSANLPSYVDDILQFANVAAFPATGETGKIYVAVDTGDAYRWTGTTYLRISDRVIAANITDSTAAGRAVVTGTAVQGREALGVDIGNVYNWFSTRNTKRVARSLAKAMTPGFAGSHLVIGDSESSLYVGPTPGPAVQYFAMWPHVLRQTLSARGIPLAGTGWVPTTSDASLAIDPRYTTSGTWTVGFGGISTTGSGASLTFTSDLPGTAISVAYRTTSGGFTVSIDGGTAVAVTPAGGALDVALYTVTGLSEQTHTVTITRTSGTVWIYAVNCYRTSGLQIHNLAQSGTAAHQWAAAASESRSWLSQRLGITPDVVHVALGVNDLNYSRTPAETATNVQTVANLWPNADRILYAQYAPSPSAAVPTPPSDATWADYVSRLYTLADTLDCPLIDLYQRSGGYAAAAAAGLMGDTIHPNAVAQADWGRLVASTILKGV
jgi:lysophospholipase L1-like esterase